MFNRDYKIVRNNFKLYIWQYKYPLIKVFENVQCIVIHALKISFSH